MIILHYTHDKSAVEWVSEHLEGVTFDPCVAMPLKDHTNTIIGGIVYNNFITSPSGESISIEMTIATADPRWCTRSNLLQAFAYPFIQLGVKRVQATCARSNKSVRNFLERLGFQFEGIGREAWHLGGDCAVYSMLKNECKWLNYGKKLT